MAIVKDPGNYVSDISDISDSYLLQTLNKQVERSSPVETLHPVTSQIILFSLPGKHFDEVLDACERVRRFAQCGPQLVQNTQLRTLPTDPPQQTLAVTQHALLHV